MVLILNTDVLYSLDHVSERLSRFEIVRLLEGLHRHKDVL